MTLGFVGPTSSLSRCTVTPCKNLSFLGALAVLWELVFRTLKKCGVGFFQMIFLGCWIFKKERVMPA